MFLTENQRGNTVIDFDRYESYGLKLDEDGNITDINVNIFARHLCDEFDIAIRYDNQFYQYKDYFWQKISELELKRTLRGYFNSIVDDEWTESWERAYLSAYIREMPRCEDLISGDDYINLLNGLFRLNDKWEFIPHDKNIFTTTQIPITFDKNQKQQYLTFMRFLNDIFNNDKNLIMMIQEIFGYCLINSTQAHKFFLFYGRGRNGKSVLLNVITTLIGKDNISNISLKSFNVPFELANIVDKKVNISTENNLNGAYLQTDKLKMISARDPIQINPKNEKPFSYQPFAKLIFAVNQLPSTADTSEGFADRLIIVPFDKKYVDNPKRDNESKRDPELTKKIMMELDGIFVFALKGLRRLVRNGYSFTESEQTKKLLNQYMATINPYIDFVDMYIYIEAKIPRTTVYENFKQWARLQGFKAFENISARVFYEDLSAELHSRNISFSTAKIRGTQYFKGFKLSSNALTITVTDSKTPPKRK